MVLLRNVKLCAASVVYNSAGPKIVDTFANNFFFFLKKKKKT